VRLKLDRTSSAWDGLKVLNIVVMPLVLTLALFGWHRWRVRRRRRRSTPGERIRMQMNQKAARSGRGDRRRDVLLVAVFGYRSGPARSRAPVRVRVEAATRGPRRLRLQSSAETVTLARTDAGWGVEERSGYPADFSQLETLLEALANARLLEQKTAKPEFFERLGLVDIEQPGSEAVQLEIWNADEQPFVRVLLGKTAEVATGATCARCRATGS
jgi:hypothetical protein